MVDNAINRSIQRVLDDMGDLQLVRFKYTFTSVSQQYLYSLPMGSSAQGTLTLAGVVSAGVTFTITVAGTVVTYTSLSTDSSLATLLASISTAINKSAVVTSGTILVLVSPSSNAANSLTLTSAVGGIAGNAITLTSTSSSGALTLTASGATLTGGTATSPDVRMVQQVRYQPQGLPYVRTMIAGAKLVSYEKMLLVTGAGYLSPYSFGTEPQYVAVTSSRANLQFFPAPISTGDLITVDYAPILTAGTGAAPLVNDTDTPPYGIKEDWYDAIVYGALAYLWMVARESGATAEYRSMYKEEIDRLKMNYRRNSSGDGARIQTEDDVWDSAGIGSYGNVWGSR